MAPGMHRQVLLIFSPDHYKPLPNNVNFNGEWFIGVSGIYFRDAPLVAEDRIIMVV
jgi:hypothetical protein